MYKRFLPGRKGYRQEFLDGVELFDEFARSQVEFINNRHYRCPCAKCQNRAYREPDDVRLHLYQNGFVKGYWYWTPHGKVEPTYYDNVGSSNAQNLHEHIISSPIDVDNTEPFVDHVEVMVNDVMITTTVSGNEQPNAEAQTFYNMLQVAETFLGWV